MGRKNRPKQQKAKRRKRGALDSAMDFLEDANDLIDKAGKAYDSATRLGKKVYEDVRGHVPQRPRGKGHSTPPQEPEPEMRVNEFGYRVKPGPGFYQVPHSRQQTPPEQQQNEHPGHYKHELTLEQARQILGLETNDTREIMEQKWAIWYGDWKEAIKVVHPDNGGDEEECKKMLELRDMKVAAKKKMLDYYYRGIE